jgi:hypothetical protein
MDQVLPIDAAEGAQERRALRAEPSEEMWSLITDAATFDCTNDQTLADLTEDISCNFQSAIIARTTDRGSASDVAQSRSQSNEASPADSDARFLKISTSSVQLKRDGSPPVEPMTIRNDYRSSNSGSRPNGCDDSTAYFLPLRTSPELDAANECLLMLFLQLGHLLEPSQHVPLIQYIQHQKVNFLCAENFADTAYFQEVAQELSSTVAALNAHAHAHAHAHVQKKAAAIQAKPAEAAANSKAFNAETEQFIKAEIARQNGNREQFAQAFLRQLLRFKEKWNNEEFLLPYVKPSSHLLQVKKVKHSLILAKDFGKTEDYRLRVESLEKPESESAQRRAEERMQSEYGAFLQKQESERAAFDHGCRRALTVFMHQRE